MLHRVSMSANNDLCTWAYKSQKMREYHDTEWGRPLHDEISLFIAGRFPGTNVLPYIIAQLIGAVLASATVSVLFGIWPCVWI